MRQDDAYKLSHSQTSNPFPRRILLGCSVSAFCFLFAQGVSADSGLRDDRHYGPEGEGRLRDVPRPISILFCRVGEVFAQDLANTDDCGGGSGGGECDELTASHVGFLSVHYSHCRICQVAKTENPCWILGFWLVTIRSRGRCSRAK